MPVYEDSHLRCPRDGKRMMVELGPDDEGRLTAIHECWHCGYERVAPRIDQDIKRVVVGLREERAAAATDLAFDGKRFISSGGGP